MNEPSVAALIVAGSVAGVLLLRRSWRSPAPRKLRWTLGGWAVLAATLLAPAPALGGVRGPFIAVTLCSLVALGIVASGAKRRAAKARSGNRSLAPEPLDRPPSWWRSTLRWLLAGPIGMVAAMAVGIAYAVWVPGEPQTRLVTGGLLVPVLWGGAMAWTLADSRILRATAVLAGVAVAGFGLSILRGFA